MRINTTIRWSTVVIISLTLLMSVTALQARPNRTNLKSYSTAGIFADSLEIVTTNPHFLAKRLKGGPAPTVADAAADTGETKASNALPLKYGASATLGKDNIYTSFNNLNDDGSFLIGSAFKMFGMGWGTYLEFRHAKNAQNLGGLALGTTGGVTADTTPGNTLLNSTALTTKNGEGSISLEDYYDPSQTGLPVEKGTLNASGELYQQNFDFNFKLAGTSALSDSFHLGASFERFTFGSDDLGNTVNSTSTTGSGKYKIINTDLLSNEVLYSYDESAQIDTSQVQAHNVLSVYSLFKNSGPFKFLSAGLSADLNTMSTDSLSSDKLSILSGVNQTSGESSAKITNDSSGLLLTPSFTGYTDLASHEWEFQLEGSLGSLARTALAETVTTSSIKTSSSSNSLYKNNTTVNNSDRREEVTNSILSVAFQSVARRRYKNLLIGYGASYRFTDDNLTYNEIVANSSLNVQNDGNGITDAADFSADTTSSYTREHTANSISHTLTLPVGVEYFITPAFALRLGFSHTWQYSSVRTASVLKKSKEEQVDVDREDIAGNESTADTYTSGNTPDTLRKDDGVNDTINQTNRLMLGIGYTLEDRLQFDLALENTFESGTADTFDAGRILFNATLLF